MNAVAKPRAKLDQWRLANLGGGGPRLEGIVFGDAIAHDGDRIFTGVIQRMDAGFHLAETAEVIYDLGEAAAMI